MRLFFLADFEWSVGRNVRGHSHNLLRCYPSICMKGLEELMKNSSQDIRYSNLVPTECDSDLLHVSPNSQKDLDKSRYASVFRRQSPRFKTLTVNVHTSVVSLLY
jgi:hypothetical protein